MLARIRTSQILAVHVALATAAIITLVSVVHYPDVTRRPMPPPANVFFALLIAYSIASLGVMTAGVLGTSAHTRSCLVVGGILWVLGCYGLVFVWINTFGT